MGFAIALFFAALFIAAFVLRSRALCGRWYLHTKIDEKIACARRNSIRTGFDKAVSRRRFDQAIARILKISVSVVFMFSLIFDGENIGTDDLLQAILMVMLVRMLSDRPWFLPEEYAEAIFREQDRRMGVKLNKDRMRGIGFGRRSAINS